MDVTALRALAAEVLSLHRERLSPKSLALDYGIACAECFQAWPCDAVQIAHAVEGLLAGLDRIKRQWPCDGSVPCPGCEVDAALAALEASDARKA